MVSESLKVKSQTVILITLIKLIQIKSNHKILMCYIAYYNMLYIKLHWKNVGIAENSVSK